MPETSTMLEKRGFAASYSEMSHSLGRISEIVPFWETAIVGFDHACADAIDRR
jgi:hypothetical protein